MSTHLAGHEGYRAPPIWAQPGREPSTLEEAGSLPPWKERQFPAQDRAGRTRGCSNHPPHPSLPVPGDSHLGEEPREEAGLGGANSREKKGNVQPGVTVSANPQPLTKRGDPEQSNSHP